MTLAVHTSNQPLDVNYYHGKCQFGDATLVMHGDYVVGLALDKVQPEALLKVGACEFDQSLQHTLSDIFDNKPVKMLIKGTELQVKVWQELLKVQASITYKELAQRIQKPLAWRAVANAVGANPISVLIPCHRIVGSNGLLRGYRWGVDKKRALLQTEGIYL